ncbi:MAG: TonB-dependent receptor [Ignavibacteria bacterium]|nr:TonB-dependent receptor [Ignavibacteria bacterium]
MKSKISEILIFLGIVNLASYSQLSDTVTIDEIVVSGKLKTVKLYAPNKVQIFNSDLISSLNSVRLSDLLKHADGIFIKDYGYSSGLKTISLNSSQSEHVGLIFNGIKLNNPQNGQFDLSLLGIDNLESIEVSSGGSSALYGSESVAGLIYLKTQSNFDKGPVFSFSAGLASFGMRKFRGSISGNLLKSLNYSISVYDETSENNYSYFINTFGGRVLKERKNSDYKFRNLFSTLKLDLNEFSSVTFLNNHTVSYRGVPGPELGYEASSARQDDKILNSSVNFNHLFSSKSSLNTVFSYQYSYLKYYDPASFGNANELNSFFKVNTYDLTSNLSFGLKGFEFQSGLSARYSYLNSNQTENARLLNLSLFFTGSSKQIHIFRFYPSLRYDYYSHINTRNVFTGKFGINVKPFSETDLSFKTSFGNNFRAPTFNEIFWKELGNKNLQPEKSISFDGGIYFRILEKWNLETELSYSLIHTKDRIVWRPENGLVWRPVNISRVRTEGILFSAACAIRIWESFKLRATISYSDFSSIKISSDFPGDPSYMKQMIYLPEEMLKSSLMIKYLPVSKLINSLSLNIFFRYNSDRFVDVENKTRVPAFDVTDAYLHSDMKFSKLIVGLRLGINNLFDEEYEVIAAYPQPVRNYNFEFILKY